MENTTPRGIEVQRQPNGLLTLILTPRRGEGEREFRFGLTAAEAVAATAEELGVTEEATR